MRTFTSIDELRDAIGEELEPGEWLEVDQDRVNTFADATEDHQWIHVDTERAAAGPFGGTIAHGYLTLSLIPVLGKSVFTMKVSDAVLNYGLNKARFPTPVKVGQKVRAHVKIAEVTEVKAGHQLVVGYSIEIEGEAKPACVAETVVLVLA